LANDEAFLAVALSRQPLVASRTIPVSAYVSVSALRISWPGAVGFSFSGGEANCVCGSTVQRQPVASGDTVTSARRSSTDSRLATVDVPIRWSVPHPTTNDRQTHKTDEMAAMRTKSKGRLARPRTALQAATNTAARQRETQMQRSRERVAGAATARPGLRLVAV
jgi:hypothetical protein